MINERQLSKTIRTKWGKRISLFTFESALVFQVPDLHCLCYYGEGKVSAGWIELKVAKSDHCQIPWQKGQPQWIDQYVQHGGRVLVIVLTPTSFFIFNCSDVHSLVCRKLIDLIGSKAMVWCQGLRATDKVDWDMAEQLAALCLSKPKV